MPLISKPTYPVVDPYPTLGKLIMNFNLRDSAMVVGGGISGYALGFYYGIKVYTFMIFTDEIYV